MLLPFFQWCEGLWLGQVVIGSNWLFPVIESVHLLFLALLGGSVLLVDLRLIRFLFKDYSVAELAGEARPYMMLALVGMVATGVPLFLSEPIKCYYSSAFWLKMEALAIAQVFTFTIRTRVTRRESLRNTARRQMLVGAVSIALWLTVAASGRWIGFSQRPPPGFFAGAATPYVGSCRRGKSEVWMVEGGTPNMLLRRGITKQTVASVTVSM